MKFVYQYRTRANEVRSGEVRAADRDAAFAALKAQGIRPSRLEDAPGFFNKLFGKGKRWIAIAVLALALAAALCAYFFGGTRKAANRPIPRAQLYGDPATIQQLAADGWRKTFVDAGDAWFARHAIPAAECDCKEMPPTHVTLTASVLRFDSADAPELVQMKRMVNFMKREFSAYVDAGGSVGDYMRLCDERLAIERGIVANLDAEFRSLSFRLKEEGEKGRDAIASQWDKHNATLRSFGLPTVLMPEPE